MLFKPWSEISYLTYVVVLVFIIFVVAVVVVGGRRHKVREHDLTHTHTHARPETPTRALTSATYPEGPPRETLQEGLREERGRRRRRNPGSKVVATPKGNSTLSSTLSGGTALKRTP